MSSCFGEHGIVHNLQWTECKMNCPFILSLKLHALVLPCMQHAKETVLLYSWFTNRLYSTKLKIKDLILMQQVWEIGNHTLC